MKTWCARLSAGLFAGVLSACGGGGGDDTPPAAVSFSPPVLTANVTQGRSATLTVVATAGEGSGINGSVYAVVVDPRQVLTGQVNIVPLSARAYSATLYTSPALASGRHQGNLQVNLCRDLACASQYPGSPVALPYDITVAAAPLTASTDVGRQITVALGGPARTQVRVSVVAGTQAWTATSSAAWLRPAQANGTGSTQFSVGFDASSLPLGRHEAVLTLRTTDGQTQELAFTLDVQPPEIVVTSGNPAVTAINGSEIAPIPLRFQLSNEALSPWTTTTSTPWLSATPLAGTTPATLTLNIDPARGPLASGVHTGQVRLAAQGVPDKVIDTQLTLVPATLSSATTAVTFGGPMGRDVSAQSMQFSLNTGTRPWPWRLASAPAWLTGTPSGQVAASGATLALTPSLAQATPGSVSGAVVVSAQVNGDEITLPVTANLNLDQRRLLPSAWGIGFAQTAGGGRLTRTLTVKDNFGGALAWTASADQSWLNVTASGNTGGTTTLLVTADPAGLLAEGLHEATITLASGTAGVEGATIRVALWKSASGVAVNRVVPTTPVRHIAADPVRPWVYAHAGASGIDVYHVYTGQKLRTIANVGSALGTMAISPDGRRLFALDTVARRVAVVDLSTQQPVANWPLTQAVDTNTSILVIRPNGVELVLTGTGQVLREGTALPNVSLMQGSLAASADGRRVVAQNRGLSPASVAGYDVDYSAISGGVLSFKPNGAGWSINGASNGADIAIQADGSAVYVASGAPYRCSWVEADDFTLVGALPGGNAYPNNVEVTGDGRVLCGISASSSADFWVHGRDGAELSSTTLGQGDRLRREGLRVSSDDGVAIALSEAGVLRFVWIGY